MRFADTRPPVDDGSNPLQPAAPQPMPNRELERRDERLMSARYTAAKLRVQMRPDDWASWTADEKRKHRNARKAERRG